MTSAPAIGFEYRSSRWLALGVIGLLLLVVLSGSVRVNGELQLGAAQMATLGGDGEGLALEAGADGAKLLLLAGEPIDEPVVGYGPFVMNSREQIEQAIADFNAGRFGRM